MSDSPMSPEEGLTAEHRVESDGDLELSPNDTGSTARLAHSRWVVRPTGVAIAIGLLIGGAVLSGIIGDGAGDTVATADDSVSTVPATTVSAVETTAPTPVTTSPPVLPDSTTPPPDEPRIEVTGLREACKFGNDCLIVSFELVNFDPLPSEFSCEFSNGSYAFTLRDRPTVDRACMSGDPTDTITIVVDGVRSETISRDSLG